mmetsp:Transcript_7787/g.8905  ORF Transcript_7787/g.8905 Transcript_7787/m.8905 type:complete len:241 (-) Transcript_7787:21-743(-)
MKQVLGPTLGLDAKLGVGLAHAGRGVHRLLDLLFVLSALRRAEAVSFGSDNGDIRVLRQAANPVLVVLREAMRSSAIQDKMDAVVPSVLDIHAVQRVLTQATLQDLGERANALATEVIAKSGSLQNLQVKDVKLPDIGLDVLHLALTAGIQARDPGSVEPEHLLDNAPFANTALAHHHDVQGCRRFQLACMQGSQRRRNLVSELKLHMHGLLTRRRGRLWRLRAACPQWSVDGLSGSHGL